jgi:hypothetical protein
VAGWVRNCFYEMREIFGLAEKLSELYPRRQKEMFV